MRIVRLAVVSLCVTLCLVWLGLGLRFGFVRVEGQLRRHVWMPVKRRVVNSEDVTALPRFAGTLGAWWIVSLPAWTFRRAAMANQLGSERTHPMAEWVDGIDGSTDAFANDTELRVFIGSARLAESGLDSARCRASRSHCAPHTSAKERNKIALDLFYVRLMQRMLSSPHDAVLVMEDDAILMERPASRFLVRLNRHLRAVPDDFDLLTLFCGPSAEFSDVTVSPSDALVRLVRSCTGTVGFVLRRTGAARFLEYAPRLMPSLYVDLILQGFLPEGGLLRTYHVAMLDHDGSQPSAIGA